MQPDGDFKSLQLDSILYLERLNEVYTFKPSLFPRLVLTLSANLAQVFQAVRFSGMYVFLTSPIRATITRPSYPY
jgi:hypothetical protein